jgi:hypothetical protein
MIAMGFLFVCVLYDCFRGGGWKPKSWYCGISSMSCSSAHHADCICVGPTAPCSFGSIVAILAFLTP